MAERANVVMTEPIYGAFLRIDITPPENPTYHRYLYPPAGCLIQKGEVEIMTEGNGPIGIIAQVCASCDLAAGCTVGHAP